MMIWANVSEEKLNIKKEIETSFGETLSWEYMSYVRKNPIEYVENAIKDTRTNSKITH